MLKPLYKVLLNFIPKHYPKVPMTGIAAASENL